MVIVILCGGVGARLWPASRRRRPKPFMLLPDGESLIGKTLRRAAALPGLDEILIVTNADLESPMRQAVEEAGRIGPRVSFIFEPVGRNTAPAVALAALETEQAYGPGRVMFVLAADHLIADVDAFAAAAARAEELAMAGRMVTFGIKPEYPETGYGYIEASGEDVVRFVEKPPHARAVEYVASGRHYWNSGMFMFTAGTILEELRECAPDLLDAARACCVSSGREDQADGGRTIRLSPAAFSAVPAISVDYAVMEKTKKAAVVACNPGWSDLGSWDAVWACGKRNADNNCVAGEAILKDVADSLIQGGERLVAVLGLKNLILVDTPDALLVADKSRAQEVKAVYDELAARNHPAHRDPVAEQHAWGGRTALRGVSEARLAELRIAPGKSACLTPSTNLRHWLVVSGEVEVSDASGAKMTLAANGVGAAIPAVGVRAFNPGAEDAVVIETELSPPAL